MNKNDTKKEIIQGGVKKLILHNEGYETTECSCKATGRTGIFWVIQKKTPQQNTTAMQELEEKTYIDDLLCLF